MTDTIPKSEVAKVLAERHLMHRREVAKCKRVGDRYEREFVGLFRGGALRAGGERE